MPPPSIIPAVYRGGKGIVNAGKKNIIKRMPDLPEEETPVLVVDAKKLNERIRAYQSFGTLCYPVKSNSAGEVLTIVKNARCRFLVSCVYYLEKLRAAGVGGELILYDNCIAGKDEIAETLRRGVRLFVTDSEEHFALIRSLGAEARFLVKVSSDGVSGKREKFGLGDFVPLKKTIEKAGGFEGLSFYIGDSVFSYQALERQLAFMSAAVKHTPVLNVGGSLKGLLEDERMRRLLEEFKARGFFDTLFLEPGRGLLNPCVTMRAKVKRLRILNGERRLYTDASIYSGLMDVYIENRKLSISAGGILPAASCHVYGSTSDSADFLGTHLLPGDVKEGDLITIADCGAYSWDITSVYSGARPLRVRVTGP
jgi:diaminopimelate decarboxylase/aspartate kinase